MFAAPEVVQFLAAGVKTGRDGKPTPDWSNPTIVLVEAAGVADTQSSEVLADGRESVTMGRTLYFKDKLVAIDRSWRCFVRGDVMVVHGRPRHHVNPLTGWVAGTECDLRWADA